MASPVTVTRFWMSVDRRGADECWNWTAYTEGGYGRFFDGTKMRQAHELALEFTTGERRHPSLDTCHSCHNPLCCNPAHLRFDTRQSNVDDMTGARRQSMGERNGHSRLTEEQVVAMRYRHASGASGRSLAIDYGVSEAAVQAIVTGRNWKHADGPIRSNHGNRKHGKYERKA